jgi:hypothetical protein
MCNTFIFIHKTTTKKNKNRMANKTTTGIVMGAAIKMKNLIVLVLMVGLMASLASAASDFGLTVTTKSPIQVIEGETTETTIEITGQGTESYSGVVLTLSINGDAQFEGGGKSLELKLGDLQGNAGGFLGMGASSAHTTKTIGIVTISPSKIHGSGELNAKIVYTLGDMPHEQGPFKIASLDIVGVQSQNELDQCLADLKTCGDQLKNKTECPKGSVATGAVTSADLSTSQWVVVVLVIACIVGYSGYRKGESNGAQRYIMSRA